MYRKFHRRPQPVSTHQLEESLDKSYASMQSQLELVDKLQRIFGENPSDPLIRFQIQKIKKGLSGDIKRLALTGTDIHQLQEQFGAELVRGQIINARKTIEGEKDGHNGQLTDLINDDQFADAFAKNKREVQDPMLKAAMREHVQSDVLTNPSRLALQDYYFRKGMPLQKAFNKSLQEYTTYQLSDKDKSLLETLQFSSSKLPTTTLQKLAEKAAAEKEEEEIKARPPEEMKIEGAAPLEPTLQEQILESRKVAEEAYSKAAEEIQTTIQKLREEEEKQISEQKRKNIAQELAAAIQIEKDIRLAKTEAERYKRIQWEWDRIKAEKKQAKRQKGQEFLIEERKKAQAEEERKKAQADMLLKFEQSIRVLRSGYRSGVREALSQFLDAIHPDDLDVKANEPREDVDQSVFDLTTNLSQQDLDEEDEEEKKEEEKKEKPKKPARKQPDWEKAQDESKVKSILQLYYTGTTISKLTKKSYKELLNYQNSPEYKEIPQQDQKKAVEDHILSIIKTLPTSSISQPTEEQFVRLSKYIYTTVSQYDKFLKQKQEKSQ